MFEPFDWSRPCVLRLLARLSEEDVQEAYARLYGTVFKRSLERTGNWVLARIPISLLNYQTEAESSPQRIALAREYAALPGEFPPGIATYHNDRSRRVRKVFVSDGNHRTLAAVFRGACDIQMYMPAPDFDKLREDVST